MSAAAGAAAVAVASAEAGGGVPPAEDAFAEITRKLESGARLTRADGCALYDGVDLLRLGRLARARKLATGGDRVYVNVNCHINPTNVCKASCAYCGFARKAGDADAYVLSADEIAERASAAAAHGVREFHLVGGLHPTLPLSYFTGVAERIAGAAPGARIKAFTAVEVDFYAERDGLPVAAVLEQLAAAGVKTITGGGAEIFAPHVRRRLTGHNVTWERWADVHRAAHALGMRTSATMLYGHIEDAAARVDHMLRLRELQDETGGFDVFVPLRFQPAARLADLAPVTAAEALRTFAVARLLLDNFDHVKAFAVMHGVSLAQMALDFGADDIEGTVSEYKITRDAVGELAADEMRETFCAVAAEGGWRPTPRDTDYSALAGAGAGESR